VGDALRSLSPELRQVLLATVVDGLSTKEAAHLLGIPQGTVKSRVRVAKARLREQLMSGEAWS
jgi:RNA polymerase sigma factor (sigma-70 family)